MSTSKQFSKLDDWAARHRVATITRHFLVAANRPQEDLLARVFRFLIQEETLDVLGAWQSKNDQAKQLFVLAKAAQNDFPPLLYADADGKISNLFDTVLVSHPLATMIASPMPPLAEPPQRALLAALKTLTLIRSFAHAENGWRNGPEIDFVCRQIRLATDQDIRNSDKLAVIYGLSEYSGDLPTYLASLNSETTTAWEKERVGTSETVIQQFIRRIKDVANNKLSKNDLETEIAKRNTHVRTLISPKGLRTEDGISELEEQLQEFSELLDTDIERSDSFQIAEFSEPVSPELQYRVGRGYLLQTQADRNYLLYAWNRLRPDEIEILRAHLAIWLEDDRHALLASFTTIALIARCSLETACNINISGAPEDSTWTLDVEGKRLVRQAMRPQSAASSDPDPLVTQQARAGWVQPLVGIQSIMLSPQVVAPLAAALAADPGASELGKLWPRTCEATPWTAFNQLCARTPGLERVTQGLLGHTAEQIVFEDRSSAVMARMLLVPKKAAKAPASWYASWNLAQTNAALGTILPGAVVSHADPLDTHNGLGSEIDPIDERLRQEFETVRRKLEQALTGNTGISWIDLHNLVTTYCLAVLFACTGARVVRSVFERRADFDLEARRLFIDDKAVAYREHGRWGRLVPLPDLAVDALQRLYLPFLQWLLAQLQLSGQHELAPAIEAHLSSSTRASLPFFFHLQLNTDGTVSIGEVSEAILIDAQLFAWPLPWNLFRHRLSTRLRTLGLDEELVAAQLGHAESGESTFGDYSTRCWVSDEKEWQGKLCDAVGPLGITIPEFRHQKLNFPSTPLHFRKGLSSYGSEVRQRERLTDKLAAKREARAFLYSQISVWAEKLPAAAATEAKPKGKERKRAVARQENEGESERLLGQAALFASIDPDRWTQLGNQMLTTSNGMPRPNGPVWFEAYEEIAEAILKSTGVRMRSRLAARRLHIERPAFHEESIGITRKVEALRQKLDSAFSVAPALSKMPHHMKETLLAFDLCLNSRVTDVRLLARLTVKNRQRIAFHIRNNMGYLAFKTDRTESDGLPFAWYVIPGRSAQLVLALQTAGAGGRETNTTRALLQPLMALLGKAATGGRDAWTKELARLVDLENAIVWPGIAAGARAGRVRTWSVSEDELARVQLGKRLPTDGAPTTQDDTVSDPVDDLEDVEQDEEEATPPEEDVAQDQMTLAPYEFTFPYIERNDVSGENSERLLRAVRSAFVGFDDTITKQSGTRAARGDVAGKVHAALMAHGAKSSTAVQLLVAWVLELLSQKRATQKWLKAGSILRYLAALSVGFGDFGKDFDLINADELDIEEFYDRVLRRPHISSKTTRQAGHTRRRLDERYTLARLMDFHRFAEREYGLDSPDWSALGSDLTGSLVSAHLISPVEYQHTLKLLCPKSDRFHREALIDAFVLILAYRFGLRGAEAISMDRSDWIELAGGFVVLVSGKHRKTKTYSGRRQVPLFGRFSDHERHVIDSWMKHWEVHSGAKSEGPLFFAEGLPGIPTAIHRHRASIVSALREVTGSKKVTLHHARHSFANLLAQRLIFPVLNKSFIGFNSPEFRDASATATSSLFLGTEVSTRRAPWALAVSLGHAHPQTTFNHYVHLNHDWGNELCRLQGPKRFETPVALRVQNKELDLSRRERDPSYLQEVTPRRPPPAEPMTPKKVLQALRLCARGVAPETAAWQLGLSSVSAQKLRAAFDELDFEQLTRKPRTQKHSKARASQSRRLMANRSQKSWGRVEATIGLRAMRSPAGLAAVEQIAGARQVLVWTPQHLSNLEHFLESIGWNQKNDVEAYAPDGFGLMMQALAAKHGLRVFPGRQRAMSGGGSSVGNPANEKRPKQKPGPKPRSEANQTTEHVSREVQVEVAWVKFQNMLRRGEVSDRLAIVPSASEEVDQTRTTSRLSRPEFVLVWLAMQLGEATS